MECRSCGSENTVSIIKLGQSPLANGLLEESQLNDNEPKFNLEVMLCKDCGLAQLLDTVPPGELFSEYLYFSSNSATMVESARVLVERMSETLNADSLVIEIASNDGYLLQHYINNKITVLGVEPARNIAKVAIERGVDTLNEFFTYPLARSLVSGGMKADIIHANNVMAHVPDINDFVKGIKELLKEDGQAIIEVPYLLDLVDKCEFDTIYHEHVYYFAMTPLRTLFARNGLQIHDVEKLSIHGGSLRLFISHANSRSVLKIVDEYIENEGRVGLCEEKFFVDFSNRLLQLKSDLKKELQSLRLQNKKIVAYGASAKGATLLNYFDIGKELIDFVVDRSPAKQGLYTPGKHLQIHHPDKLKQDKVDYALLLTWNFADEILAEQKGFKEMGGKFIIPIPYVKVV